MKLVSCVILGATFICVGMLGIQGKLFTQQPGGWQYGVSPKAAKIVGFCFVVFGLVTIMMGIL